MITLPPEVIPVAAVKVVGGGVEREYEELVIGAADEEEDGVTSGVIAWAVLEVDTGATGVVEVVVAVV